MDLKTLLIKLKTSPAGLSEEEALFRMHKYGANVWSVPVSGLKGTVPAVLYFVLTLAVFVLCFAAYGIYQAVFTSFLFLIPAVLTLFWMAKNTLPGSERAFVCVCKREGEMRRVDFRDLVRGDVVFLKKGDVVPADIVLITAENLKVCEYALKSSTDFVKKESRFTQDLQYTSDSVSMVYAGSAVISGKGTGIVTETGAGTLIGSLKSADKNMSRVDAQVLSVVKLQSLLALAAFLIVTAALFFSSYGIMKALFFGVFCAALLSPIGFLNIYRLMKLMLLKKMDDNGVFVRDDRILDAFTQPASMVFSSGDLFLNQREELNAIFAGGDLQSLAKPNKFTADLINKLLAFETGPIESRFPTLYELVKYYVEDNNIDAGAYTRAFRLMSRMKGAPEGMEAFLSKRGGKYFLLIRGDAAAVLSKCTMFLTPAGINLIDRSTRSRILQSASEYAARGDVVAVCEKEIRRDGHEYDLFEYCTFLGYASVGKTIKPVNMNMLDFVRSVGVSMTAVAESKADVEFLRRNGYLERAEDVAPAEYLMGQHRRISADRLKTVNTVYAASPELKKVFSSSIVPGERCVMPVSSSVDNFSLIFSSPSSLAYGQTDDASEFFAAAHAEDMSGLAMAITAARGFADNMRRVGMSFMSFAAALPFFAASSAVFFRMPSDLLLLMTVFAALICSFVPSAAMMFAHSSIEQTAAPKERRYSVFNRMFFNETLLSSALAVAMTELSYYICGSSIGMVFDSYTAAYGAFICFALCFLTMHFSNLNSGSFLTDSPFSAAAAWGAALCGTLLLIIFTVAFGGGSAGASPRFGTKILWPIVFSILCFIVRELVKNLKILRNAGR